MSEINGNLEGVRSAVGSMSGTLSVFDGNYPVYTGAVEVTPSEDEQTLSTTNRTLLEDVVINPIPSNYGLITWNGVVLTVS